MDYFRLDLPYPGVLSATTTGPTDTHGQLWHAPEGGAPVLVAEDADSGARGNFQLGPAVSAGTDDLAVAAGTTGTLGAYTLAVQYTPGLFETPRPASPQSGISLLSGWVGAADSGESEGERPNAVVWRVPAAAGPLRTDTAGGCGDSANGFGLWWNWNKLGPETHTVRAVVDGSVWATHPTPGAPLG